MSTLEPAKMRVTEIRILLDGPTGPEAGRFVEIEDADGNAVNMGDWHKREDGYWELCLPFLLPLEEDKK